jgi:aminoglycoside 3-N-acetyltransferase
MKNISFQDKILSSSPWVEVFIKYMYWNFGFLYSLLSKRKPRVVLKNSVNKIDPILIKNYFKDRVADDSIFIVHSSSVALLPFGLKPKEIVDLIVDSIGSDGTLAMPAIPYFKEEPQGPERLSDNICSLKLVYDVNKTPAWTGALPNAMRMRSDAIRSKHPLNTMVAVGKHAFDMMQNNIEDFAPLACGLNSSWKYCADRNATIVCLGVDMSHSLTMIHVAEDCWVDEWPIKNWYRKRSFLIKDGTNLTELEVRERHPKWSINYAERTLQKDLVKHGILKIDYIGDVRVESCKSAELITFLHKRVGEGYPYFIL